MAKNRKPSEARNWSALPGDELLSTADVCAWTRCSFPTVCRWRDKGIGPAYIRLGQRRIVYRAAAIREWLRSQETSASVAA
jgi:predicted DNA-binding transcriptional regulator AlpA